MAQVLIPEDRMIHFPTCDQDDTITPDPPHDRAPDLTAAQLQASMRDLDNALAESQRLRASLAPRLTPHPSAPKP